MQISAAGSPSAPRGFTLLELLVVVAIMALATVGVGLALRDSAQVQLESDAQRLAALLDTARARARISGVPVRWLAQQQAFRFEGLAPQSDPSQDLPSAWLHADTGVAQPVSLQLGPEPVGPPQAVELVSRSQPGLRLRVASDGVRPFALEQVSP